ncbi:MAG: MGMT family protein [Flavobacteriales bacterium]|jgi:methylated-DNA-protein-cysteine methyltransferase-like protein|nr:MGMT family protein [Flavobacteriales bacterium]MBT6013635.1 MGMT family protein [Flavobacteriales bacterium]MBT7481417.1 MGMT family protein [Flavobacteriales bacterium]
MKNSFFFQKVYDVCQLIPEGRVSTYGAISKYISSPQAARMVGWALNKCPENMPAHRVVSKRGLLTGKIHFSGINLMQQLLENEGIVVKENQIQNFKIVFWDPTKELT